MKSKATITLFIFLILFLFAVFVIRKYSPYHKDVIAASTCGAATMTDPRDGQVYPIVQIGTQCWMAKNLNIGARINGGVNQNNPPNPIQKYCWNNSNTNCATYGGYYQWHEAMQFNRSCNNNNSCLPLVTYPHRGICPAGWHIPSDVGAGGQENDWSILENFLKTSGQSCSATRVDAFACADAGTKMQVGGGSGLEIRLVGSWTDGSWIDMGADGHYWTSAATAYTGGDSDPLTRAWARNFDNGQNKVLRKGKEKGVRALSVRCVKDPTPPTPTTPIPTPTTPIPTPTLGPCQVRTSPATLNLSAGGTGTVTASVISGLGSASITRIDFGSYDTSIATVSPASDASSPYSTTVTGVSGGSTAVWGTAYLSDDRICTSSASDDTNVNVTYTISGSVFNDVNKDKQKNTLPPPGESNYAAVPGISISPVAGTINAFPSGAYTISNLPAGTYTVSYTSLPVGNGYFMIWPQFAFYNVVTVGSSCDINSIAPVPLGASCTAGNVANLNFAISNSMPWIQTYGLDIRVDNGFDNPQPASPACGGGSYASGITGSFTSPGIVFTGDTTAEFGQGSSSSTDWVVGGSTYPEVFTNVSSLKTSTQNLLNMAQRAGIPVTDRPACANNCNLPAQKGFYHILGNWNIDNNENFNNGNYIFVADGTITISNNKKITVDTDAMAIFSANNIIVDSTIGADPSCSPLPAGQLQGVFSADNNITIEGNNGICTLGADKMLNIDGTLIANATQGSGIFKNNRDICGSNLTYPSITIKARPDFILNIPSFLREPNIVSQEGTP